MLAGKEGDAGIPAVGCACKPMKKELRKMKKFRFQLLHQWIFQHFKPCKVADIGGGKGLLTLLLNQSGFQSVVIDPYEQSLPKRFKDIDKQKHKISAEHTIPRIDKNFEKEMAKDFDLLIGLHAHGSNMKIIEAAAEYKNQAHPGFSWAYTICSRFDI